MPWSLDTEQQMQMESSQQQQQQPPSQSGIFFFKADPSSSSSSSSSSKHLHQNNQHYSSRKATTTTDSVLAKSLSDASSQSLASILNNPLVPSDALPPPEFLPLPNTTPSSSQLNRSDFDPYSSSIAEPYGRFEDVRNHATKEKDTLLFDGQSGSGSGGDALVSCLREVPALYFKEDFALQDGATFRAACPFSTVSQNLLLQEKLSHYLDVVEMHLVREISLRSSSFFEAQGQLQDLNLKIVHGCSRIRELKETVRLLDADLLEPAHHVQELNATRTNLLALQHKLRLILYVNQSLSALKLLVASADCAGALDVIDALRHVLDGDKLAGLHCFRHLRDHVAASIDSVNSILSAEFLRGALHGGGDIDMVILSKAKVSVITSGKEDEVLFQGDETFNIRDRLLPVIIGLLRTAKLPSVLRVYRDALTADMKSAIKMAVAELLRVLIVQLPSSDFLPGERVTDSDGGGSSLASQLRSLSSESFVQLLGAIFMIVRAHLVRAAEVKKAIEWIMSNVDGHYAANSVARTIALGEAADTSQESDDQIGSALFYSHQRNPTPLPSFQGKANDGTSPSNMSRNFRADVLRENTEAVFAACDSAHGRWAKLLGVRAIIHPRLRLQEFLSIYGNSQEFITATEKIGGRLGYSIRGMVQSQAKAFVDCQHELRMAKLKAVLDQETWVEIDVPDEFQVIVASVFCTYLEPTENPDDAESDTPNIVSITSPDDLITSDAVLPSSQEHIVQSDSSEARTETTAKVRPSSVAAVTENGNSRAVTSSDQGKLTNTKERGKSTSQTLSYKGVSYHMVNCGLILLKMLSEYIDVNSFLPSLSSEVVHRVVEILKFFNTRTCQLVLGAGAMQVAGLKSITSKHLALASQVISFTYAIIPEIRRILFLKVPETRKPLLLSEIDRVAQDYKVHRDEIHTKLVQIMQERLLFHLRGLPQIVENWSRHKDNDSQPSQFARSLTKEVGYLQRVLSRTLLEVDVQAIFSQVVIIFHSQISEAISQLDITTPHAKKRLHQDIEHILACIRSLPSDSLVKTAIQASGQLDEFLLQRFDDESAQQRVV